MPAVTKETASAVVADLTYRNRAYQLLYALGAEPATVETLEPGAAEQWCQIAREVLNGLRTTQLHRRIAFAVPVATLRYVATGRI
jgi:hypothetical protein